MSAVPADPNRSAPIRPSSPCLASRPAHWRCTTTSTITATTCTAKSSTRPTSTRTDPPATMPDFLLYALIAGLGLALVAGTLGSCVVWRRMAYFGDTLAHSALLGVALGMLLQVNLTLAVTAGCVLLAVLLVAMQNRKWLASDTLLGILAHSTLSLGLVVLALTESVRADLLAYLFGDLLAITRGGLAWMLGGLAIVMAPLAWPSRPSVSVPVQWVLPRFERLPVSGIRLALMLPIALVIAAATRVVGGLRITPLLIIPPAAAQRRA